MSERWQRIGIAVALAAIVAYSFYLRWSALTVSPYPLGVDGYFYPLQVRALLEHGALAYPASPLTFWWMAPFAAATDPITGAKLGAALGGALIALPAYGIGARLGKARGAGLVAAALAAMSAGSAYASVEFVKQGIGLTVALAALWLVLRALDRPSRARLGAAAAGIAAALLAHKMAGALVVLVAVPAAVAAGRGRGLLRGRRLLYLAAAAIVAGGVLLVLGLVAPRRFLSAGDLALVHGLFTTHARWTAPALETHAVIAGVDHVYTLSFEHEALVGALFGVLAAAGLLSHRWIARDRSLELAAHERVAGWMLIVVAVAIGLPWLDVHDPQGLAFRLRVAAFVPRAVCGAIVAGALVRLARVKLADAPLAALALVIVVSAPTDRGEGHVLAHPALVAAAMAATAQIPPGATVIVPERHIEFMIAYYTRASVSLRPESVAREHRVRIVPLAFIGEGSPLEHALDAARAEPTLAPPIGLHPRYRNGLVLVPEATWEWVLAQLPDRERRRYAAWPTI